MFGRSIQEHRERREAEKAAHLAALMKPSRALHVGVYEGGTAGPVGKEPEPVRDESYRRWVATLPCFECRIQGYSQAAHPNTGKAKGKKLSDRLCFPMCCDRPEVRGCHTRFDQYELVSRDDMADYEAQALEWTREQQTEGART